MNTNTLFKKGMCLILSAVMVFSSGCFESVSVNIGFLDTKAAAEPSLYDSSTIVDSTIIPDTDLLIALKNIINDGNEFTFGDMQSYDGSMDFSDYTNISDITGLGFAVNASSINLSACNKVTTIPESEFNQCTFTTIELPPGLVEIGADAFSYCKNLTTVDLPDTLKIIGKEAFYSCSALNNVDLPDGLERLGNFAFSACTSLESVVIPDGLDSFSETSLIAGIGSNVYDGCTSLSSITLSSTMTAIPTAFLKNTTNLTSISIPSSVASLGAQAFAGCGINEIDLSDCSALSVVSVQAFSACPNLKYVDLPQSVTKIDEKAFYQCTGIDNIDFLGNLTNLTTIGNYAFSGCCQKSTVDEYVYATNTNNYYYTYTGLKNVVIPENVTTIGTGAFAYDYALETVEFKDFSVQPILKTVKSIGSLAFYECSALTDVILPEDGNTNINVTVEIGSKAFQKCYVLSNINFPSTLTTIGDEAFSECSVTKLKPSGTATTYYCYSLDDVISNEDNGGDYTRFYSKWDANYYGLTYAYIDTSQLYTKVSALGLDSDAKEGTDYYSIVVLNTSGSTKVYEQHNFGLTNIDLSSNTMLTSIGEGVFSLCGNIQSAALPSNLKEIPAKTFKDCFLKIYYANGTASGSYTSINTFTFSNSVTSIGNYAFYRCYKLNLNDALSTKTEAIGNYAFYQCYCIGGLTFPATLISIGKEAFKSALSLSYVDFSKCSKLESMGSSAFESTSISSFLMNVNCPCTAISAKTTYNCLSLSDVRYGNNVKTVAANALGVCPSLRTVSASSVTQFNSKVLYGSEGGVYTYTMPSFTIRNTTEDISLACNYGTYLMDINTATYVSDTSDFNCKINKVKVGDYEFEWDDSTGELDGSDNAYALPSVAIAKANSLSYYALTLTGNGEPTPSTQKLEVELALTFEICTIDSVPVYATCASKISYNLDVVQTPCESITCDTVYLNKAKTGTTVTISPVITPVDTTDTITWEVETNSENITLTPSADGMTATVLPTGNGCGGSKINIYAGNTLMCSFYVYVYAPTSGISLSSTSIDIPYKDTVQGTATLSFNSAYYELDGEELDYPVFSSSDESIVTVTQGTTTYDSSTHKKTTEFTLYGKDVGSATITVVSATSAQKKTITVRVASADIGITLADSESNAINNNDTIYLDGKISKVFSYDFTESVGTYKVTSESSSDSITTSVNTSKKTITIGGTARGTYTLALYPYVASIDNAINLKVKVLAPISTINMKTLELYPGSSDYIWNYMRNVFYTSATEDITQLNSGCSSSEWDAFMDGNVEFISSDTSIATVNKYGKVTAVSEGTVTITCNAYDPLDSTTVVKSSTKTVKVLTPTNINTLTYTSVGTYQYTGKQIKPSITIKDSRTLLTAGTDYTISYGTNKSIGKGTITIKGKNKYTGTRTISFNIIPNTLAKPVFKSNTQKTVKLSWTAKNSDVTGYQVYMYNSSTKTWVLKKTTTSTSCKITKLTPGTKYKFKVRSYKVVSGTKYYSAFSPVRTTCTKPKRATISGVTALSGHKIKITWKKVNATGYEVYMSTKKSRGYVKIKTTKKTYFTKKSLTSGKKYYFKVRAYVKIGSKKYYGKFSKVKYKRAK
ncbi:MAG: leucine-rich repeat protein [Eubacterium sp.]